MNLRELEIGKSAIIGGVGGEGSLRQHFLDMGLVPGAEITLIKYAPMGDPAVYQVHGYELTLRLEDARNIEITDVNDEKQHQVLTRSKKPHEDAHPGLGEDGIFHVKADENPLPKGEKLTFALVGNPDAGKTTLFNQLTGNNQHMDDFNRKSGPLRNVKNGVVVDLPSIYSLSPYTADEVVSRQYILDEKPKGIINIVDATNIERNLYLTMQLMELDVPMVLGLNMMDEVRKNGGHILVNEMESMLGIPVVPICAIHDEGIDELIAHAAHIAQFQEKPGRTDFCDKGPLHRCIHGIMSLIEDHAERAGMPVRFAATKMVEGDPIVKEALDLTSLELKTIEEIITQMEDELGLDRASAIADMRYEFIQKLCAETVVKPEENIDQERSDKADEVLTGKFTAIPSFILIMGLIFYLTFDVIGSWLQGLLAGGISDLTMWLDKALTSWGVNDIIHSLIIDGAIGGVGIVLSFVPIIVILFFFLSILEDSGYMARIAFVMDKLLRKIGLSGRSIVPMLIGFGCSTVAIMSTRSLPSMRDRKMTIMMIPFMSCTAKLPIYTFFSAAFFPGRGALIMFILYFGGILTGILCALLTKKTLFKGEAVPFVMELSPYRMPALRNVGHLLWDKTRDYVQNAFTVIFLASLVVWFLETFNFEFNVVADAQDSMLASISGFLTPVFAPLGLGDWRITTALVTGLIAKESVVSSLSILYSGVALTSVLNPVNAMAMLVFCLLYTPCVAAITAIKRELGAKWMAGIVVWQFAVAWIVSGLVALVGNMF
ncbi:MAG: ferrous iron transport protein B [Clostridia bacterium]|nr:ferrous iron transport protein B [Clostridia bacterium]